jgi:Bacterial HORMA domain family 1
MSASYTRSNAQTNTLSKVIYVTRKVQADLLAILDCYQYFPEEYAQELIQDLRSFIDEEVIERIKFIWIKPGTNSVLEELDYLVVLNGIGLTDDRSGGIRFHPDLSKATFRVQITHNTRWQNMSESEKQSIRADLKLGWGVAARLTYQGGRWHPEKTYSQDDLGLTRSRYTTL